MPIRDNNAALVGEKCLNITLLLARKMFVSIDLPSHTLRAIKY